MMLSITRKIIASLQDRKLGERDGRSICPVKQKLEQEEMINRESTKVHEDHEKARMCQDILVTQSALCLQQGQSFIRSF